jgi:hypothetical protein
MVAEGLYGGLVGGGLPQFFFEAWVGRCTKLWFNTCGAGGGELHTLPQQANPWGAEGRC